ncbi:hemolysin family protein [Pannonibacter tanglangensis]|uniref:CBS domain-containing protein n=1 Tax=Pannonibacter tanglangensis TaxID=2750084 RepID=A0ABW9ZRS8_9HYPH|nr:hemolysin family protein [Pannonibacter sp. XCT-34]NBN65747.1 CBS domain-containing protein [Pannonibacter sp. XCT-34]
MNVSESRSIEAQPNSVTATADTRDSADPRSPEPRKSGPFARMIGHFLRLRRGSGATLRENLEDELARDTGSDAAFSPEERMLLGNILRLRGLRVDDVMVPRADIVAVDDGISLGRLLEVFRTNGHSRLPVYHETLDDPRGMIHIKDLMAYVTGVTGPARAGDAGSAGGSGSSAGLGIDLAKVDLSTSLAETGLLRSLLFVPPSMPATDLMAKMQASRVQMALVIDEYGGTDGLVSLEDIVETVVGDIEDEHDEDQESMLLSAGDGIWIADPRIPLEDLSEQIGTDFNVGEVAEEVDTLGGLLFTIVGRVPVRGELIAPREFPGFEFEILDADPRRIKRLRVRRRRTDKLAVDPRRRQKRGEKPADDVAEETTPTAG